MTCCDNFQVETNLLVVLMCFLVTFQANSSQTQWITCMTCDSPFRLLLHSCAFSGHLFNFSISYQNIFKHIISPINGSPTTVKSTLAFQGQFINTTFLSNCFRTTLVANLRHSSQTLSVDKLPIRELLRKSFFSHSDCMSATS